MNEEIDEFVCVSRCCISNVKPIALLIIRWYYFPSLALMSFWAPLTLLMRLPSQISKQDREKPAVVLPTFDYLEVQVVHHENKVKSLQQ